MRCVNVETISRAAKMQGRVLQRIVTMGERHFEHRYLSRLARRRCRRRRHAADRSARPGSASAFAQQTAAGRPLPMAPMARYGGTPASCTLAFTLDVWMYLLVPYNQSIRRRRPSVLEAGDRVFK